MQFLEGGIAEIQKIKECADPLPFIPQTTLAFRSSYLLSYRIAFEIQDLLIA